ncbi:hypothetical protein [Streptomyces sp. cg2]|uniref:hypothetical protein n=1 Tax=Streptomyces sp. cg2 TaxID=3238799 RepID=UPI0034E2905A
MRRISQLLTPLTKTGSKTGSKTASKVATRAPAAPAPTAPATGFLTIGSTTYINPTGTYPLLHAPDGALTPIANDTDRPITIITESDLSPPPPALVLAPGERTETRSGDCVQVG